MNIRQSLIDAAGRSAFLLGPRVADVVRMLARRQNPDGGFRGKGADSDLYYTGFALLSLIALKAEFDTTTVISFLDSFKSGQGQDLAHLAALIRQRMLVMNEPFDEKLRNEFREQVETFLCDDGGYHHLNAGKTGSAYGCFLAIGAYQDLGVELLPERAEGMLACIRELKSPSGGFFNETLIPAVSVPATAAAMVIQKTLTGSVKDMDAATWLLKCLDEGGFRVMPIAPVADLLSTAVALHSLAISNFDISTIRQSCLCFVDLLWNGQVGFCANAFDAISDPEYMFYGLLSLGHLSGM
ncbi:MAG: terpene cyclase/mutase family protein [Phycisphaerae bacterium]|nr:terpene cyclase/mutase family protein [Phycisphaerae bacterium]